jgi:hypothetical protein
VWPVRRHLREFAATSQSSKETGEPCYRSDVAFTCNHLIFIYICSRRLVDCFSACYEII